MSLQFLGSRVLWTLRRTHRLRQTDVTLLRNHLRSFHKRSVPLAAEPLLSTAGEQTTTNKDEDTECDLKPDYSRHTKQGRFERQTRSEDDRAIYTTNKSPLSGVGLGRDRSTETLDSFTSGVRGVGRGTDTMCDAREVPYMRNEVIPSGGPFGSQGSRLVV